ncbi:MAG TPA: hypothetical protein VGH33_26220, partial [Isosphaeraceae bacterium]
MAVLAIGALGLITGAGPTSGDEGVIRLTQAQRGAFNVGDARGAVQLVADPASGGDVLKLDYTVPVGTAFGIWTKDFPKELAPGAVDVVRPVVRSAGGAGPIAVALEIKGTSGVQKIPLDVGGDPTPAEQLLDWPAIGALREVVVSVTRVGQGEPAVGSLWIDVRFAPLPPLRKLALSPPARFGGVILAGIVAACLATFLRWIGGDWKVMTPPGGIGRDLIQGVGAVAIAALALGIEAIGGRGPLEVGWAPVWLALAGAA